MYWCKFMDVVTHVRLKCLDVVPFIRLLAVFECRENYQPLSCLFELMLFGVFLAASVAAGILDSRV